MKTNDSHVNNGGSLMKWSVLLYAFDDVYNIAFNVMMQLITLGLLILSKVNPNSCMLQWKGLVFLALVSLEWICNTWSKVKLQQNFDREKMLI
jgi:hypothetical protein